ncbi:unnamed protein product [Mesocestoides corti]|uniref:Uncharacterized protein n=1 Tax=Mesocestoides corti TaxID=53468 RepID=A0A0R3UFK4_MESCO|nr:unnamed protein product [Mesocestoides corti]
MDARSRIRSREALPGHPATKTPTISCCLVLPNTHVLLSTISKGMNLEPELRNTTFDAELSRPAWGGKHLRQNRIMMNI